MSQIILLYETKNLIETVREFFYLQPIWLFGFAVRECYQINTIPKKRQIFSIEFARFARKLH